jgi:hypothetical protein
MKKTKTLYKGLPRATILRKLKANNFVTKKNRFKKMTAWSFIKLYGPGIIFVLLTVNYGVLRTVQLSYYAQSCMTTNQVSADSRCLYIYGTNIYQKGSRSNTHYGHPCGSDVTSVMPGGHSSRAAQYLDPTLVGAVCSSTPTPTQMQSPTATPRPSATNTPRPTATATPRPTATNTPRPTATATPRPTATPGPTATNTPHPTATVTQSPNNTATPTHPAATATLHPTATNTQQPTSTIRPTATNTQKPAATTTPKPTTANASKPTYTPTPRHTITPTQPAKNKSGVIAQKKPTSTPTGQNQNNNIELTSTNPNQNENMPPTTEAKKIEPIVKWSQISVVVSFVFFLVTGLFETLKRTFTH